MTELSDFNPKEIADGIALVDILTGAYLNMHRNTSYSKTHREQIANNRRKIEQLLEFASLNLKEIYG